MESYEPAKTKSSIIVQQWVIFTHLVSGFSIKKKHNTHITNN